MKINTNKNKNRGDIVAEAVGTLLVIVTMIFMMILAVIAKQRGYQIQDLKQTAVKLGHAEYIIVDLNGKTEFRWITNKSNLSTNLTE